MPESESDRFYVINFEHSERLSPEFDGLENKINQIRNDSTNMDVFLPVVPEMYIASMFDYLYKSRLNNTPTSNRTSDHYLPMKPTNVWEVTFDRSNSDVSEVMDKDGTLVYYIANNILCSVNRTFDSVDFMTVPELYIPLIKHDYMYLSYLDEHRQTYQLLRRCIEDDSYAIKYVKNQSKFPDLCKLAVENFGPCIADIKDQTPELCKLAVSDMSSSIKFVKDQTEELSLSSVTKNGFNLCYIRNPSRNVVLAALSNFGYALKYVKTQDKELCRVAVESQPLSLAYVNDEFKTDELYTIAVVGNGLALQHVPEERRNVELCERAVMQNTLALRYATNQTHGMCMRAVKRDPISFTDVQDKTYALCSAYVLGVKTFNVEHLLMLPREKLGLRLILRLYYDFSKLFRPLNQVLFSISMVIWAIFTLGGGLTCGAVLCLWNLDRRFVSVVKRCRNNCKRKLSYDKVNLTEMKNSFEMVNEVLETSQGNYPNTLDDDSDYDSDDGILEHKIKELAKKKINID